MKQNQYVNTLSIFIITALFIASSTLSVLSIAPENNDSETNHIVVVTNKGHVTTAIWDYSLELQRPQKALALTFNQNLWEPLVAVCAVPVFIGRNASTPLFFSDGTGEISTVIPYDTKAVSSFGSTAASASAGLAQNYWTKAELVFAVNSYEEALWIVPSASFLGAPILVTPTAEIIQTLDTKCIISVGNSSIDTENLINLPVKEDVWSFQLELFRTKGEFCNYVILTNPYDINISHANIKWHFQSPAAALLGAYRHGIIQTGDWSIPRDILYPQVQKGHVFIFIPLF